MTVEFQGVSTASLGEMLKGYGIMAGVAAKMPDARFWWTPTGTLAAEMVGLVGLDGQIPEAAHRVITEGILQLAKWASSRGEAFEKPRKKKGQSADVPPLKNEVNWRSLDAALAVDAEGVGVFTDRIHRPNPVLANWGQDGSGNLFTTLREAGAKAARADIDGIIFGNDTPPHTRLAKGSGVLFPEGIKRYATGASWIQERKKPLGVWDLILAIRGLLLLRGAVRSPRGSRFEYPAFPFTLPGSVIRAQGSTVPTQEVFLPTWSSDHPRTLAEFQAQVRGFQAHVGKREFASGAAEFRRAVAGRAVTGAFDAFYRFALEPRKPGQRSPQNQAISRGLTAIGPASAASNSLRFLLAPLDDSRWLENFRLPSRGRVDATSEDLALAKKCFDDAIHAALDARRGSADGASHVAVLEALWNLQIILWKKRPEAFRPAPLLEGHAWQRVLSELLENSGAARLGWALASLGWVPVPDDNGQDVTKPVVEQLLPVTSDGQRGLRVPKDPLPAHRVCQPGHNPPRELAALFWRRWLDTLGLPVLPTRGTRPANAADVAALLCGDVEVKDMQRYLVAFLVLDKSGDAVSPTGLNRPVASAYAALRLWLELAAWPTPGERRPLDGAVPRGIATGTAPSVASACHTALRRLRVTGLPGCGPEDRRPTGKSVAQPNIALMSQPAALMAAALLVPVCQRSVARLAHSLLVPSASHEPRHQPRKETDHA